MGTPRRRHARSHPQGETAGKQVFIKHRLVDATNVDEVLAQAGKN